MKHENPTLISHLQIMEYKGRSEYGSPYVRGWISASRTGLRHRYGCGCPGAKYTLAISNHQADSTMLSYQLYCMANIILQPSSIMFERGWRSASRWFLCYRWVRLLTAFTRNVIQFPLIIHDLTRKFDALLKYIPIGGGSARLASFSNKFSFSLIPEHANKIFNILVESLC